MISKDYNYLADNRCFACMHCKKGNEVMQCHSEKANTIDTGSPGGVGRGIYCYPNSYDDCDCGDFTRKKEAKHLYKK